MPEPYFEAIDSLEDIRQNKGFLNREFLTWLWYTAEESGGEISVELSGKLENVELWLEDKIVLESQTSHVHKQALKGGQPGASLEATAALISGKSVSELKMGLSWRDSDYIFNLNSKDLQPTGIALPTLKGEYSDQLDVIHARAEALQTIVDIIDALFLQFLRARTNKTWENNELGQIKDWIEHRSQGEITFH